MTIQLTVFFILIIADSTLEWGKNQPKGLDSCQDRGFLREEVEVIVTQL
jgi:hypothetical protein